MTDSLIDDVKTLLDKDFGEDRILKQILRACENDEVISNYERNYVKKLAEKYLGRKSETNHTKLSIDEKSIPSDVVIPIPPLTKTTSLNLSTQTSSSNSKNSKKMLGIGGVLLGVIIIIAVSINGMPSTTIQNPVDPVNLSVQTDLLSYNKNDIISINGMSKILGNVNLSIKNQSNIVVWEEQIVLKSDGTYSTLSIAGGSGWETSGTYTIKVDNGEETKLSTFSFTT